MNLSFFAYVDESTDEACPAVSVIKVSDPLLRGERRNVKTDDGDYDLIGMDAITYKDEADLVQQVNAILKELNL